MLFHVSLLQNWHSRSRRNTFRRNPGGCALFSSVRFVINRKGCEAKIAESTPLEIWVCFFKEGKRESSPFKIVTVHYPSGSYDKFVESQNMILYGTASDLKKQNSFVHLGGMVLGFYYYYYYYFKSTFLLFPAPHVSVIHQTA